MVGHGGSSAGSYLADPTSPIPSHCASIVVTSTVRVNMYSLLSPLPGKLQKYVDNKWQTVSEEDRYKLTKVEGQVRDVTRCKSPVLCSITWDDVTFVAPCIACICVLDLCACVKPCACDLAA